MDSRVAMRFHLVALLLICLLAAVPLAAQDDTGRVQLDRSKPVPDKSGCRPAR